ncbi:MAG TPA: hypothetical protein VLQ45_23650 [Thermoanaerobaculia bacterium]|nr:hypothetical protein [Thermoanaerobaculia bacterium]
MTDESDFPPDDSTELLEQLEDLEEEEYLAGRPPTPRPLTRTEIDGLVNETLNEELARRRGAGSRKSGKE